MAGSDVVRIAYRLSVSIYLAATVRREWVRIQILPDSSRFREKESGFAKVSKYSLTY
jgi:hypothetical protein